jgi:hypothetical protein
MLFQKRFPMWIGVSLFAVSIAMVPLIYRVSSQPIPPPGTLTELTELLSQKAPELHVVPRRENGPVDGLWVSVRPLDRDQLPNLSRIHERGDRWQGIVFCEQVREGFVIPKEIIHDWGEYGLQIGPFLFFGDPDLLRRIRALFPGEHHA